MRNGKRNTVKTPELLTVEISIKKGVCHVDKVPFGVRLIINDYDTGEIGPMKLTKDSPLVSKIVNRDETGRDKPEKGYVWIDR